MSRGGLARRGAGSLGNRLDGFQINAGGCVLRRTALQKCAAVPMRARSSDSWTSVLLNSSLESNTEEKNHLRLSAGSAMGDFQKICQYAPQFPNKYPAVERMWHLQDSQGQIMALAFTQTPLKPFKLFPLRSDAESPRGFYRGTSLIRKRAPP